MHKHYEETRASESRQPGERLKVFPTGSFSDHFRGLPFLEICVTEMMGDKPVCGVSDTCRSTTEFALSFRGKPLQGNQRPRGTLREHVMVFSRRALHRGEQRYCFKTFVDGHGRYHFHRNTVDGEREVVRRCGSERNSRYRAQREIDVGSDRGPGCERHTASHGRVRRSDRSAFLLIALR